MHTAKLPPSKSLPMLVNAALVAILGYLFWQVGLQVRDMLQPEPVPVKTPQVVPVKPVPEAEDTGGGIASMHLFGEADVANNPVEKIPLVVPETKLSLTLRGIIASDEFKQGFAIIQNNSNKEERYFSNKHTVFGLATLEEVHAYHVILLHNGKYETLRLPKDSLSRKHFSESKGVLDEKKKIVTDFRKILLSRDGEALNKLFGFDTIYKNGGFKGFAVHALGDEGRGLMETLGVKDGDLITVVNGMRLSESLEAVQKLKDLKTATSVDIIIERDGTEIPFHFDFDAPSQDVAGNDGAEGIVSGEFTESGDATGASSSASASSTGSLGTNSGTSGSSSASASSTGSSGTSSGSSGSSSSASNRKPLPKAFDESEKSEVFKAKQRARTTATDQPVEYDH